MRLLGCLPLPLFLILLTLLPFVFGELFSTALMKLHLDPRTALLVILGMLIGSGINIPIRRLVRDEDALEKPPMLFGLSG